MLFYPELFNEMQIINILDMLLYLELFDKMQTL